jgi:hypothetical protein
MRFLRPAVIPFFLAAAAPLHAQQRPLGALEGTLLEPVDSRSVRGAELSLRRIDAASSHAVTARADAHGRYRLDSLPIGRYRMEIAGPTLDSLALAAPAREVRIESGRTTRLDFTLPSGVALRDVVCRDTVLERGRVAVAGHAFDADAGRALARAELVAKWMEFPEARSRRRSAPTRRVTVVRTGAAGQYRVCGAPSETLFSLQLRHGGRATPGVRLIVSDVEGAVVRDFSLSARSAPSVETLDSLEGVVDAGGARRELELVGDASLAGEVRGLSGQPIAGARVHVRDARAQATTDSAGRFALASLPAGTQILVVQHAGFPDAERVVDLRAGRPAEQVVLLVKPAPPDPEDVTATLPEYAQFDANRRTNTSGQFITLGEIDAKKSTTETVDLFDDILGFSAFGHGPDARLMSNRALSRNAACTSAGVFVQAALRESHRINDVTPGQIGAIEAYADADFLPARYAGRGECGVIVIWLRKSPRATPKPLGRLRENGYP